MAPTSTALLLPLPPMTPIVMLRLLVLCVAALLLLSEEVQAVSRTERGALELLFWATDGRNWATGWDVQNEQSDPCLDAVRGRCSSRFR